MVVSADQIKPRSSFCVWSGKVPVIQSGFVRVEAGFAMPLSEAFRLCTHSTDHMGTIR